MEKIKFAEVIGPIDNIKRVYWGTAPTSTPHIGYLVPLLLICQLLDAGVEVVILLADLHAMLDNLKSTPELIEARCKYYEATLRSLLLLLNADTTKLTFVKGTSFQLTPEYTFDVYRMQTMVTEHDAKKAGTEVVSPQLWDELSSQLKQTDNPKMSSLNYPLLQALDEVYLKVDAELGGIDQRKIFMLADKYLPKMGYKSVTHLMNVMLPSLTSSDSVNSKITFTDSTQQLEKKIKKAFCEDRNVDNNPLLQYYEHIIVPLNNRLSGTPDAAMPSIETMRDNFKQGLVVPQQLKLTVRYTLEQFLSLTRIDFETSSYQQLVKNAYPE
jgi:tyrosyl-tRNA synthetase